MATFRLPRLPVNWKEQPQLFERYWDETLKQIEKTLNAILDIPSIQAAVSAAQAAAVTAQAAADTAQSIADDATSSAVATATEASLVNSYTNGFSGALVTANAAGNVTIKNHTRVYGDSSINPSRSVTGATISTSASPGDVVRVYYDDASRAGGAVSYQFTIDPALGPVQGGNRHSVGAVEIPMTGTVNGKTIRQPGYVEL